MTQYDVVIRGGTIYDGSGAAPFVGDVAVKGDTIIAVGQVDDTGETEVDARGLAVAPGFINMLSWAVESLIADGRSQSDIRQGVTLEVMGEGSSMGPLNDEMKKDGPGTFMQQGHIKYPVEWTTLGEYLEWLERRGVSTNIASFVGTSTLRIYVIGYEDRPPTDEELGQMRDLVRQAMEEGAMGLSAALIYPPASYADTDELIDLAFVVAEYNGLFISHIRSEGSAFHEALDELIEIARETGVRAEIYHLKAAGQPNWDKMDGAIAKIEQARAAGLSITADMYTYPFSGTGLSSCIPPWAHEGGHLALIERLKDPETRERIKQEMLTPTTAWENMYLENGPDKILLAGFKTDALKPLAGKRLSEVATMRGTSPEDTLLDLIVEDDSRIFTMYFSMSEDNLRKQIVLPWVSFCSDAESLAPEGVFLQSNPHPRAYGSFARVIGKYVRDEKIIPLEEAVRRLTSFPADNLKIEGRGWLKPGYYADVVIFDPDKVQDYATPENPHQYSTGMIHVFVNGVQVLKDGEHTGAKPGRVVRGPGWKKAPYSHAYPEALHPFLTLGGDYDGTYLEFDIGKAHIPDLIRMATDLNLLYYFEDRPQSWAPAHAWRRLGQLQAKEAIEPLTTLFNHFIPKVAYELPDVYGLIGAPAIPVLADRVADISNGALARMLAARSLEAIANQSSPEIFDLCEAILLEQLEKHAENPPIFNSLLINILMSMDTGAADEAVIEAYEAGHVEEEISGTWKDVRARLGLPPLSKDEEESTIFGGRGGHKSGDVQKKAKRKQASKMKKLNRKKKR